MVGIKPISPAFNSKLNIYGVQLDLNSRTKWRPLARPRSAHAAKVRGRNWRVATRSGGRYGREPRGNRVIRNLRNFGYPGRIVAVNPKYSEVMDCPCYPDLAAIPEPIDCVVLAVPNRHVPDLLESAAAAGVRAGVVFSAGFAEMV